MSKLFSKKGDLGKTNTLTQKNISKNSPIINALGDLDELNCFLGLIIANGKNKSLNKKLLEIQNDLFLIGSLLSAYPSPKIFTSPNPDKKSGEGGPKTPCHILSERATFFESEIDRLTKKLPPLTNFILPGGTKTASGLHLARAITRRLERSVVPLVNPVGAGSSRPPSLPGNETQLPILQYLNRLSDYLFILARWENFKNKKKEILWQNPQNLYPPK